MAVKEAESRVVVSQPFKYCAVSVVLDMRLFCCCGQNPPNKV